MPGCDGERMLAPGGVVDSHMRTLLDEIKRLAPSRIPLILYTPTSIPPTVSCLVTIGSSGTVGVGGGCQPAPFTHR
jgi:hypothetical protein